MFDEATESLSGLGRSSGRFKAHEAISNAARESSTAPDRGQVNVPTARTMRLGGFDWVNFTGRDRSGEAERMLREEMEEAFHTVCTCSVHASQIETELKKSLGAECSYQNLSAFLAWVRS
jgi:hypothetical protein